jgi:DNA-binding NtrC family response regulator
MFPGSSYWSPPLLSALLKPEHRVYEGSRKVFVVDDEALIADSVTQILSQSGFAATAFYVGSDAIEQAQVECPDIVVSDVLMPELNGVQLAIAIRSYCPGARIILFSGQAATVDLLREAERDGYSFELLPKPIHPTQLLRVLSS